MRPAPRALLGGLLATAALVPAACGGSSGGLLSSQQAAALNASLSRIRTSLNRHHCTAAQSEAGALRAQIKQLPSSVSPTVRNSIDQGVVTVQNLLAQRCIQQSTTPTAPVTPTPPPTTTKHKPKPPPPPPTTITTTTNPATPPSNPGSNPHKHGHPKNGNGNSPYSRGGKPAS